MASPQKENGFTSIANEIIERLVASGLNGTELAVVIFVLRKTYGFNKKEDEISLSQFLKAIPVSKQTLCVALNNLQLVKILRLVKKGTSKNSSNLWLFNKDYDTWQLVRKYRLVKVSNPTSQGFHNQLVKKPRHTKETIQKKLTKETILPSVDDEVIKKPLTIIQEIVNYFFELRGVKPSNESYSRWVRVAKQIASASGNDVFIAKNKIKDIADWANSKGLEWTLDTVLKRFDLGATLDKKEQLQKDREFLTNLKNKNYGN